jgi:hypothetical protein
MTANEGPEEVVVVVPETAATEIAGSEEAGSEEAIVETATVITPVTTAVTAVIRVCAAGRQPPPCCGHQRRHTN